jgi:hypothetical protein
MSTSLWFGAQMPVVPGVFFPVKDPDEFANFSYDATAAIGADTIVSATFASQPSGIGEIVPSLLSINGALVTVWLASGVPGRVYIHRLLLTCDSGLVLEVYIGQVCNPLLAYFPIPPSSDPGFGLPITASAMPSLDFSTSLNSGYVVLL